MENAKTKVDCFAYECNQCKALRKLYCSAGKCNFYKTKEQNLEDERKVYQKISKR